MAKRYIPSHTNPELLPWFLYLSGKKVYKTVKKK